jgi:hypothetical protein
MDDKQGFHDGPKDFVCGEGSAHLFPERHAIASSGDAAELYSERL